MALANDGVAENMRCAVVVTTSRATAVSMEEGRAVDPVAAPRLLYNCNPVTVVARLGDLRR
jgi:hypothetical protein